LRRSTVIAAKYRHCGEGRNLPLQKGNRINKALPQRSTVASLINKHNPKWVGLSLCWNKNQAADCGLRRNDPGSRPEQAAVTTL